jgi:hypothetical protein
MFDNGFSDKNINDCGMDSIECATYNGDTKLYDKIDSNIRVQDPHDIVIINYRNGCNLLKDDYMEIIEHRKIIIDALEICCTTDRVAHCLAYTWLTKYNKFSIISKYVCRKFVDIINNDEWILKKHTTSDQICSDASVFFAPPFTSTREECADLMKNFDNCDEYIFQASFLSKSVTKIRHDNEGNPFIYVPMFRMCKKI